MKFTFPKIGLRTIKTALAVFCCLLFFPSEPFFACLTAVFCVQDTVSNSINIAINRGLGTILGAILGLLFLIICRFFVFNIDIYILAKLLMYLTISIGIITVIYICNLINKQGAINISCIAFLAVTTTHAFTDPIYYAVNRIIETLFGILVALLVNKFILPPKSIEN
ncbi:MAG: FUSC family protein [Clostridium sp.]|nr:FUSC family protein [Clostridium sp.]